MSKAMQIPLEELFPLLQKHDTRCLTDLTQRYSDVILAQLRESDIAEQEFNKIIRAVVASVFSSADAIASPESILPAVQELTARTIFSHQALHWPSEDDSVDFLAAEHDRFGKLLGKIVEDSQYPRQANLEAESIFERILNASLLDAAIPHANDPYSDEDMELEPPL